MSDVLYLCYDCIDFCFTRSVLWAFARMFVLYLTFGCFHFACLRSTPSRGLSAHLRALVYPFVVN
jgi:hypothetical protein